MALTLKMTPDSTYPRPDQSARMFDDSHTWQGWDMADKVKRGRQRAWEAGLLVALGLLFALVYVAVVRPLAADPAQHWGWRWASYGYPVLIAACFAVPVWLFFSGGEREVSDVDDAHQDLPEETGNPYQSPRK